MSQQIELAAEARSDSGKGASRRLRREGKLVPGILYGGEDAPVTLTLKTNELVKVMENEAFASQIVHLSMGGESQRTIVRDVQRHPATGIVTHIDFMRVTAGQLLQISVPIHFLNEEKCVGVRLGGGLITHTMSEVEISALPRNLPEFLQVDMENVDLGDNVHLSDIQLPEGVTLVALSLGEDHDLTVAGVQAPRVASADEVEEEEGAADDDAEAGEEPAAGDDD
ncbi:MAG: 50S ribosomal protein L25/general stress protein Ctc [Pseudomonadales bacterium]